MPQVSLPQSTRLPPFPNPLPSPPRPPPNPLLRQQQISPCGAGRGKGNHGSMDEETKLEHAGKLAIDTRVWDPHRPPPPNPTILLSDKPLSHLLSWPRRPPGSASPPRQASIICILRSRAPPPDVLCLAMSLSLSLWYPAARFGRCFSSELRSVMASSAAVRFGTTSAACSLAEPWLTEVGKFPAARGGQMAFTKGVQHSLDALITVVDLFYPLTIWFVVSSSLQEHGWEQHPPPQLSSNGAQEECRPPPPLTSNQAAYGGLRLAVVGARQKPVELFFPGG